jgi:hypothetical protein
LERLEIWKRTIILLDQWNRMSDDPNVCKEKNNIVSFYLQQKMSNLDLLFDSGPRPKSRNLNPDCDFRSKFERISSQWNGVTGRSLILGDTLAPTETDFRKK